MQFAPAGADSPPRLSLLLSRITERMPETYTDLVYHLAQLEKPIDFSTLFGREAPLEIEIGIGSGYFTSRYALDHPDINLFGLDKEGSEVYRTADKCFRLGAQNVRLTRSDAIYFLHDFVAPASVSKFHVLYSDPWPKRRHHKRRLWRPQFVEQLQQHLEPGGELHMKTDVTEYFEIIDALLKDAPELEMTVEQRLDLEPLDGDYNTNFQRKAIEAGHPLYYQVWRKIE